MVKIQLSESEAKWLLAFLESARVQVEADKKRLYEFVDTWATVKNAVRSAIVQSYGDQPNETTEAPGVS